MPHEILDEHFGAVKLIRSTVFSDDRGYFLESFSSRDFRALGLPDAFVQENHSRSHRGVVRGMHFQWEPGMGKLLRVTSGRAAFFEVDIRRDSPHLGQHAAFELAADDFTQLWVPPGFANGFMALEEGTEVVYKCTALYAPHHESSIRWDDPDLALPWPSDPKLISARDREAQTFRQWLERPESHYFRIDH